jgi:general secretion pathway protein C
MSRFVIWIVNGALFVLCCFLTASLVNGWTAEWLSATPVEAPAATVGQAPAGRDWSDRKTILDRNLFQVSTLLPSEPVDAQQLDEEEQLAATRLPLKLLGTVAASDPKGAWAAVEETTKRERLVVRPQDRLLDKATVVRIERRRIVLENAGKREELALDEEQPAGGPLARARVAARTAPDIEDLRDRVQQLSEDRFEVQREDVEEAMRNPAELFSQARILPKYENGQMTGVQLNSIQPGSLFEEIGIRDGDVITQVNGIVVASPQDSAALLRELTQSNTFEVSVQGADGQPRTLTYSVQQ